MSVTTERDQEIVARTGTNGRAAPAPGPIITSDLVFMTADELGAKVTGPVVVPPADIKAKADQWIAEYRDKLVQSTGEALQRLEAKKAAGLGEIVSGTYVSYDIVSISPLQFIGNPPHLPHKIAAGGELMMVQAVQWINPRVSITEGFLNPATLQLGGRHLRVRFDQLNLTTGAAGPAVTFNIDPLPAPTPAFVYFDFFILAPAVTDTQLIEVNVTSDIVGMAQPFAAFASWHQDLDNDLPWLWPAAPGMPPTLPAPHFHAAPMRYMVFPK